MIGSAMGGWDAESMTFVGDAGEEQRGSSTTPEHGDEEIIPVTESVWRAV
jgi:hypothetical protein